MKLKNQNHLLKLVKVKKYELITALKEHVDWRKKNETNKNTLTVLKQWYNGFRLFIHTVDKRNISLTNKGIGYAYREYLEKRGYANQSVKTYFKTFLATLNRLDIFHYIQTKELFRDYAKSSKANEDTFLTDEEVKSLLTYKARYSLHEDNKFSTHSHRIVISRFIVSCFTGCRVSEVASVRIRDKDTLIYTSSKTKKDIVVPYSNHIRTYIESGVYLANLVSLYEEGNPNMILHEVLMRLHWTGMVDTYTYKGKFKILESKPRHDAITFHSGRKFFGKMLLDRDVPIYKVSQMMGHSSVEITQKYYAALNKEKMVKETNEVINQF